MVPNPDDGMFLPPHLGHRYSAAVVGETDSGLFFDVPLRG